MPPVAPMEYSKPLDSLFFEHIVRPVWKDPRTDWENNKNVSLGYPFSVIRDEVIRKGRADFSVGHEHDEYGELTADDKVLLYCFVNMKLHLFETIATFRAYKSSIKSMFDSGVRTHLIDLGCGPGTAGLALAEVLRAPTVHYIGLDCASPM
jgi:hypothetical protein